MQRTLSMFQLSRIEPSPASAATPAQVVPRCVNTQATVEVRGALQLTRNQPVPGSRIVKGERWQGSEIANEGAEAPRLPLVSLARLLFRLPRLSESLEQANKEYTQNSAHNSIWKDRHLWDKGKTAKYKQTCHVGGRQIFQQIILRSLKCLSSLDY